MRFRIARRPTMAGTSKTKESRSASERGSMGVTMVRKGGRSDNGHIGSVDLLLAREHGGRPATWHGRRFGHYAVNELAARIIRCWRIAGDAGELAEWVRPVEAALAGMSHPEAEKRADVADAEEDRLQALYRATPCAETARDLLRARAKERAASLDHDREIAARYGIEL
jgi:hypothetical protein